MSRGYLQNRILIGLITSTDYISRVVDFLKVDYFESSEAKKVATWCLHYFKQYEQAPKTSMRDLFYTRASRLFDDDQLKWFELLLLGLSEQAEEDFNVEYLVDETEKFCKKRALSFLMDEVDEALEEDNVEIAESILSDFSLPAKLIGDGLFPFQLEESRFESIFAKAQDGMIRFPVHLHKFFGSYFSRGAFVAFMGAEKSGKSFWLMEIAFRALQNGLRVAFFQAGDMTEEQMLFRMYSRQSGRPKWDQKAGSYQIVLDCVKNQLGTCSRDERLSFASLFDEDKSVWLVRTMSKATKIQALLSVPDYIPCTACRKSRDSDFIGTTCYSLRSSKLAALDATSAKEAQAKFAKRYGDKLYLSTYPNDTLTISRILVDLDIQEKQNGFVPDVIIVDYADLLTLDTGSFMEERGRQNQIWKRLRALSQQRHCCLVTATQADASSYEQTLLRRKNFSEDKRKYAHVTAMFGINNTEAERDAGMCRINALVVRDGLLSSSDVITVVQDLNIARTCVTAFR